MMSIASLLIVLSFGNIVVIFHKTEIPDKIFIATCDCLLCIDIEYAYFFISCAALTIV